MTHPPEIKRILEVLRDKKGYLERMDHLVFAEGVRIAITEMQTVLVTEFNYSLDDVT